MTCHMMSVDTGSLRGDLHEIARIVGERRHCRGAQAMGEGAAWLHRVIGRAVRRGEVEPGNPALDFLPELVVAAACGAVAVEGDQVDAAYLVRYMDAFVLPVLLRH
ncbi:hypothetical protein ACFRIB_33020 [Streptomyces mirabilis]|uniref:hypothetical protein n=1 Tax=Streptomyces mirabilis TaxID=68239 RepID=UPI00369EA4C9